MHAEYVEVNPSVVEQVKAAKARGGRVNCGGDNQFTSLESAVRRLNRVIAGVIPSFFIYPRL